MHNAQCTIEVSAFGGRMPIRACKSAAAKWVRGATAKPPEKPLEAMNKTLAQRSEWLYLPPQPPSLQREGGVTNSGFPFLLQQQDHRTSRG